MAVSAIKSDTLIDTEQNFLVKAGPGAGKTYWLIQHIKNVLAKSKRLGKIKKIACITYTNVGVETIRHRLPDCAERVDVCTIHSFLYDNIIKPYFHFIAEAEGFAIEKLKVVDDTMMTDGGTLYKIKERINKKFYKDDNALKKALFSSSWKFVDGNLKFKPQYPIKLSDYTISQSFYDEYKKYTWEHGVMHYDDVLYFAYRLMENYPFIVHIISVKYPYIFVDEFQDSTPIQVEILNKIASASHSVIGVIGDKSQAIYGFAGTDPNLFDKFSLIGMQLYEIKGNRRCSEEIISLLNNIRPDLKQYSIDRHHSDKPILYIGDVVLCYNEFKKHCNGDIITLSYAKLTSNALRKQLGEIPKDENLLNSIPDSNWNRVQILHNCVCAIEYGLMCAINDSLKSIKKIADDSRIQIELIRKLIKDYPTYKTQSLDYFILYLKNDLGISVTGLRNGAAKTFYSNHTYSEFALCITPPDISMIRDKTIHRAKGDEFKNVMVVLGEEKDIKFLTAPNLDENKDEQRVYYVAISRAKNNLAIYIPTLSHENETLLSNMPITIIRKS